LFVLQLVDDIVLQVVYVFVLQLVYDKNFSFIICKTSREKYKEKYKEIYLATYIARRDFIEKRITELFVEFFHIKNYGG
jgi:hypothetical protein